jgi:sugar phosphate isomerase/epimerase
MKFAFSSNAFRSHSLIDTIRILAGCGYEGIEIMADIPHAYPTRMTTDDIRAVRQALSDHHLAISNINAFMHHADGDTYHPSWIESDPALRTKRIEYTKRCISLAAELGACTISTEPGGPVQGMLAEDAFKYYLDGLAAVADMARGSNVRILIEPEPGLLIENSEQFLQLMVHLDPERFGLNCDVGHFYCVGEDPVAVIPRLKNLIHHFHLEDIAASREHYHLMLGEGAMNLSDILRAIDSIGYSGFVTVELYTYEHQPEATARAALDFLRRLAGPALQQAFSH